MVKELIKQSVLKDFFSKEIWSFPVIVAGLGYFVDAFDLLLFNLIRTDSLKGIGVPDEKVLDTGIFLFNMQLVGLLIGGVLWGIVADKKGRQFAMFGSILMYALATMANGVITTVEGYTVCRILSGIGLAGEVGAAVTLVSELLSKDKRGLGVALFAAIGFSGIIAAALLAKIFPWQQMYFIGGLLGLGLLALRYKVKESGLFKEMAQTDVKKGDIFMLLSSPYRLKKYIGCIMLGFPIFFCVAILATLSPELTKALGVSADVSAKDMLIFAELGIIAGDLFCGFGAQVLKKRKLPAKILLWFGLFAFLFYVGAREGMPPVYFHWVIFFVGLSCGYWANLVTISAEQFGTNLRATVASSVSNFVRASAILLTSLLVMLKTHMSLPMATFWVGAFAFAIAFWGLSLMEETFGKNLDYLEK